MKAEEGYRKKKSPFGVPHILGNDDHFISYREIYTSFTPSKKLTKGGLCADLRIPDDPKIAIIQKIAKRRRGHALTLLYQNPGDSDETVAVLASHHCVPLPAVNQYVRHKRSGIWYKIKRHGSMIAMSKVFPKAPSTSSATPTATTQTPAAPQTPATPAAPQTPATPAASQTPSQNPRPPASANTASTQAPAPNPNAQAPASAASATAQTPASNTPASATTTTSVRGAMTAPPSLQDILSMEPRLVIKSTRIVRKFIKYHLTVGLPDITDLPEVPHESMLYWKKKNVKIVSNLILCSKAYVQSKQSYNASLFISSSPLSNSLNNSHAQVRQCSH